MKVLITGAAGQLGHALAAARPAGYDVIAVDIVDLDITNKQSVRAYVKKLNPQFIINAAAYTQVDRAETERARAFAVNAEGPANLADAAHAVGARLIQISTDYVFDGCGSRPYRPDDTLAPINTYGESKLEGERRATAVGKEKLVIIRTAWLYGAHGNNFVHTMLKLMREHDSIRVVADQVGTPTWSMTLARAIWAAARQPTLHGIYHWTDAGETNWYDFAVAIQEEGIACGLLARKIAIQPILTKDYPTPARRPSYSVLDTTSAVADFGLPLLHWRVALQQMLMELKHA